MQLRETIPQGRGIREREKKKTRWLIHQSGMKKTSAMSIFFSKRNQETTPPWMFTISVVHRTAHQYINPKKPVPCQARGHLATLLLDRLECISIKGWSVRSSGQMSDDPGTRHTAASFSLSLPPYLTVATPPWNTHPPPCVSCCAPPLQLYVFPRGIFSRDNCGFRLMWSSGGGDNSGEEENGV